MKTARCGFHFNLFHFCRFVGSYIIYYILYIKSIKPKRLTEKDLYTIKQTSSNHRANIQQMHSKYTCTTCAVIARCLLDVCLMIA